jgi:hypothetical protein
MVRGASGSFLTSYLPKNGQPFHLCAASTACRLKIGLLGLLVSYGPLAHAGWKKTTLLGIAFNAPRRES